MLSFELSEMQDQIRQTARKFAQEEIAPTAIERDTKAEYPEEIVKKLQELGFMGFMVSPDWGGSGLDAVSYVIALEEICRVDASIGIIVSVHNSLACWILENYATDEQKEKHLRPMTEGGLLGAFCLSEPEAGSDATQQHTIAEKQGDYWVLNGTKNWISTAHHADKYFVFAQTDPEIRHKGIVCFVIDKGTEGLEPGAKEDKMGMRSSDTASLGLTNVKVPQQNMMGGIGDGFKIAMKSLNGGRIGIAAQALGIAQGAFDIALKYTNERKAFGQLLHKHQMIQAKLAQMSMKIEATRLLIYKAAWMKDKHLKYIRESAEAKLMASNTANEVTREAVQILGGYGYVREYQVERMMRDAKVTEIYEGTSEIQQIVIARELVKSLG